MPIRTRQSETRAEESARELLTNRGWVLSHPPRGHVLWKNEYRDYPAFLEILMDASKSGTGDGFPDFLVVSRDASRPLIVGEVKPYASDIGRAVSEATTFYGEAFIRHGYNVLAAGIAGDADNGVVVQVHKRSPSGWKTIDYQDKPIEWLPTPEEALRLILDDSLYRLDPRVPAPEVLAARANEINRILRESKIKDEFRPAIIGAFMLALWKAKGDIHTSPEYVLMEINAACRKAFEEAGKYEIAESILVPEANEKLAAQASRICRILRLLNVTTLTSAHDYLGQLYETFFRFTGGNTIGQFFTPRHITAFVTELCQVTERDVVVDPTCGTGGFLISALYRMMGNRNLTRNEVRALVADHLIGFESEPITAALCVANMILRGDGTTGVAKGDCFTDDRFPKGKATIVMGNPPFPHRNTDDPTQKFVERALEALQVRGTLAMIVPGSLLVKGGGGVRWRETILRSNTLKAVISLPAELFQPYASSTTAIVVLGKGIPHDRKTAVFFAHVENDGYRLRKGTRVQQPGEQLTDVLEAYRNHVSRPGRSAWKPVAGTEWATGAYIDSIPSNEHDLEGTASHLARRILAFQVLHAEELTRLGTAVASGEIRVLPYRRASKGHMLLREIRENTIGQLFDLYYGQSSLETKVDLSPGLVPVISSAGTDNGCHGFYELPPGTEAIQPPFVTVPRTGSIGEAFVQLIPCGVTSDCILLIPKDGTDIEDLFIAAATVRHEKWRFNYGRKVTPSRIEHLVLNRMPDLKHRVHRRFGEVVIAAETLLAGHIGEQTRKEFEELVEIWEHERPRGVDIASMVMHPAYQRIIAKGPRIIPLILGELDRKPGHWFWALHVLTGASPVSAESQGDINMMREAWLTWGREHGYRW